MRREIRSPLFHSLNIMHKVSFDKNNTFLFYASLLMLLVCFFLLIFTIMPFIDRQLMNVYRYIA